MEKLLSIMESLRAAIEEAHKEGRTVDVTITGKTVNGAPYRNRHVSNITVKHANGSFWVHGFCTKANGVRLFRMDLIDVMSVSISESSKRRAS